MPKAYEMLKKANENHIDSESIKTRARQLMREFHPDKTNSKSLDEIKKQVKNYPSLDQFLSNEMKKIKIEKPEMEKEIYVKTLSEIASIIHDACVSQGKENNPDKVLFEDEPNMPSSTTENFDKEFQDLYEQIKKRDKQIYEEKIKLHVDNYDPIIKPENKIYYVYLDRFSDGNRNLARNSKSNLFDPSNKDFRSRLAKKLHSNEGILVFETFEQALQASGKIRDYFSGSDREDVILQCSLPPAVLAKTTSVTTNEGRVLSNQEVRAYVLKTPLLGSEFFSLGNISSALTVDVWAHAEAAIDEEEADNFKHQLEANAIKNNHFPILEQPIPTSTPDINSKFKLLISYLNGTCNTLKNGQEWKDLNQIQKDLKKNKNMSQDKLDEFIARIETAFQFKPAPKKKGLGSLFSKKTTVIQSQRSDVINAKNSFEKLKNEISYFPNNKFTR